MDNMLVTIPILVTFESHNPLRTYADVEAFARAAENWAREYVRFLTEEGPHNGLIASASITIGDPQ